ncbi:MAG: TetR/AcrR family transcriptional regulator [Actinobacteria bacterium]|nr:TetR/AcrR family transcriptional regulator [Actinomycetota bacterium]
MSGTRDRLIEATAELFRRQGYHGTGVKQIVETARAPFGSMYHFFPAGKEELGAETIRRSGAIFGQLIGYFYAAGTDPVAATRMFFDAAAQTVHESDYADACPIATVALEVASMSEPLRLATAEVFESWLTTLDTHLVEAGLTKTQARKLSVSLFSLLEGSFILARATRDHTHVRAAGRAAAAAVRTALEKRATRRADPAERFPESRRSPAT